MFRLESNIAYDDYMVCKIIQKQMQSRMDVSYQFAMPKLSQTLYSTGMTQTTSSANIMKVTFTLNS